MHTNCTQRFCKGIAIITIKMHLENLLTLAITMNKCLLSAWVADTIASVGMPKAEEASLDRSGKFAQLSNA